MDEGNPDEGKRSSPPQQTRKEIQRVSRKIVIKQVDILKWWYENLLRKLFIASIRFLETQTMHRLDELARRPVSSFQKFRQFASIPKRIRFGTTEWTELAISRQPKQNIWCLNWGTQLVVVDRVRDLRRGRSQSQLKEKIGSIRRVGISAHYGSGMEISRKKIQALS